MCGRFTQAYTWQEVYAFYSLLGPARNLQPNYNAAPTQFLNVIVRGSLKLVDMRWGLVPSWWKKPLKDAKLTFNARSEKAATAPGFGMPSRGTVASCRHQASTSGGTPGMRNTPSTYTWRTITAGCRSYPDRMSLTGGGTGLTRKY